MGYQLSPRDYEMLVEQFGGDESAAQEAMRARGYDIPGEETSSLSVAGVGAGDAPSSDLSARPDMTTLAGILKGQRQSIGELYDKITENIQQRYRKPDINDLLIAIGTGMMSAPGEGDSGGFGGAVQRGLRGIGTYAQNRRAYEQDMNKMLSQVEIEKAKTMADLEEKYLSGAAAALKPNTGGMSYDAQRGIWVNRNNPRPTENTYDIGGGRTLVQWQDGLWREQLPDGTYRVFERAGNAFNELRTEGAR